MDSQLHFPIRSALTIRINEAEIPKLKLSGYEYTKHCKYNYLSTKLNKETNSILRAQTPITHNYLHRTAKVILSSLLVCYLPIFIILASMFVWWSVCMYVCISLQVSLSLWRRFGLSTFWFVDVLVCLRFGLSTFQFVDVLVCQSFGLLTFGFVEVWVCRCLGCRRVCLSTIWPVPIATNLPNYENSMIYSYIDIKERTYWKSNI